MNAKPFWNRIKALIKKQKTTQELVAKECGIFVNTWYGWVYKGIIPGLNDCLLIAKYLNVSLDYLAAGKERNSEAKILEIQLLLKRVNDKVNTLK